MRILIAEDDVVLADGLKRGLRACGAVVDQVACGVQAEAALMAHSQFDLLILDLGLPKLSGMQVLQRLRQRPRPASARRLPVLILAGQDDVESRVRGLDLSADDYMVKPFALAELEAHVRALVRVHTPARSSLIQHEPLSFDQVERVVRLDGLVIDLSSREMGLLQALLSRIGRLVSKEQLVERLCEWGEEVTVNAIEVYMHRLRKKLEASTVAITTIRGLGYCLQPVATQSY